MPKNIIKILLATLFVAGCIDDATRDNPLDPVAGGEGVTVVLSGNVGHYYQPALPVAGAEVLLMPEGRLQLTGSNGSFEFANMAVGEYTVIARHSAYRSDTLTVTIDGADVQAGLQLNAIPTISNAKITTHHISRWWPSQDTYFIEVNAQMQDFDGTGEIKTVYFDVPALAFSDTLTPAAFNGQYQRVFLENRLPLNSMYELEGKVCTLSCRDSVGNDSVVEELFAARIIDTTPIVVSPAALDTVRSFPADFTWKPVQVAYPYHFRIEIYQINFGLYTLIYEADEIAASQTQFTLNQSLSAGDYFWVVYIVDEFGDTSSSKEGAFRVE